MESTRSMQADTGVDRRELLDAVDAYLVRYGGDFVPELVSSASGSRLYTVDGRSILDFTSGQMCATLGHNHPAIVAAIEKACREAIHLFSGMLAPPVVLLARELAGMVPPALQKVLLLSTGGEANGAGLRPAQLKTILTAVPYEVAVDRVPQLARVYLSVQLHGPRRIHEASSTCGVPTVRRTVVEGESVATEASIK